MSTFADRIDTTLSRIESSMDHLSDDLDIDCARSGNVLTLTFDNTHRVIINSQEANEELWVAARSGGFHYRWNDADARWIDTRSGDDLRVALSRLIEDETGIAATIEV